MECIDARLKSFEAVPKKPRAKKGGKIAFPLDPTAFPTLTPDIFSKAGFFHKPGTDPEEPGDDNCECFLCGLVLGGWAQGDNPSVEHVKREGDCAWKELVCRLEADRVSGGPGRSRTEFPSVEELPSSTRMTEYRERTFGSWWPHKKPSVQDLALAGFIYAPSTNSDDATTCPLCQYEVEQWEKGDDPMAIHKRKEPDCPFFTATVAKKGKATRTKAGAKPKRVTRAKAATVEPEEVQVVEAPEPAVEEEAPAPRRRGRPPKASTVASTSASATTAADATPASTRGAKSTRSRRKPTQKGDDEDEPDESEVEPTPAPEPEPAKAVRETKPLPRKGRTTRQTTAQPESAPEPAEDPAPIPKAVPPRPSRAPGRKATAPLSQLDRFANVPAPLSPPPKAAPAADTPSAKASIDAVIDMFSPTPANAAAAPAPAPEPSTAFSEAEKSMTLEEYMRAQYRARAEQLRVDGEEKIRGFEGAAAEARGQIERA